MYENHYGFQKKPFSISPDPDFLYINENYNEALALLQYCITDRKGIICLTGEVGTGKTMLLNKMLATVDDSVKTILVPVSLVTFQELVEHITSALNMSYVRSSMRENLMQLSECLTDIDAHGRTVALLIDEAQTISTEMFENLRLISNIETPKKKLIQIILLGQPELNNKLNMFELRPFKQRIAINYILKTLDNEEVPQYIAHRLKVAGYPGGLNLFNDKALSLIAEYSKGTPRLINSICENSLLTSFALEKRPVDEQMVYEAARDLMIEKKEAKPEVEQPPLQFSTQEQSRPIEKVKKYEIKQWQRRIAATVAFSLVLITFAMVLFKRNIFDQQSIKVNKQTNASYEQFAVHQDKVLEVLPESEKEAILPDVEKEKVTAESRTKEKSEFNDNKTGAHIKAESQVALVIPGASGGDMKYDPEIVNEKKSVKRNLKKKRLHRKQKKNIKLAEPVAKAVPPVTATSPATVMVSNMTEVKGTPEITIEEKLDTSSVHEKASPVSGSKEIKELDHKNMGSSAEAFPAAVSKKHFEALNTPDAGSGARPLDNAEPEKARLVNVTEESNVKEVRDSEFQATVLPESGKEAILPDVEKEQVTVSQTKEKREVNDNKTGPDMKEGQVVKIELPVALIIPSASRRDRKYGPEGEVTQEEEEKIQTISKKKFMKIVNEQKAEPVANAVPPVPVTAQATLMVSNKPEVKGTPEITVEEKLDTSSLHEKAGPVTESKEMKELDHKEMGSYAEAFPAAASTKHNETLNTPVAGSGAMPLDNAEPDKKPPVHKKESKEEHTYYIQVASFKDPDIAHDMLLELKKYYPAAYVFPQNDFYKVRIPDFTTSEKGYKLIKAIKMKFNVSPLLVEQVQ